MCLCVYKSGEGCVIVCFVKYREVDFGQNFDNISFKACGNTHRKMSKKAGKKVALLPQAKLVPSGVVHMIQRQEEGWSYIRP